MKCDRDCSERMQAKTVRILRLIDCLAPCRFPKSLQEIHESLCQAAGEVYSQRTIRRDLEVLKAIGLVRHDEAGFRLDLKRSERLQCAACTLFP